MTIPSDMPKWEVELITNEVICNSVEIFAYSIEKIGYHKLVIDGNAWDLPSFCGMSFSRVELIGE